MEFHCYKLITVVGSSRYGHPRNNKNITVLHRVLHISKIFHMSKKGSEVGWLRGGPVVSVSARGLRQNP